MLDAHLPITNLCWLDDHPTVAAPAAVDSLPAARLAGRFATACTADEKIILVRDALGLNKLFFGLHPSRGLMAANYLHDLVTAGVDFRHIYSVPAGTTVAIDLHEMTTTIARFHSLPDRAGSPHPAPQRLLDEIDQILTTTMRRLAASRPNTPVVICLSGGADSAVIASYAQRHLSRVTAYTYSFTAGGYSESEDAASARALAEYLGIAFRLVSADEHTILAALPDALCHGQDWRDFNLHAAIVNEILATAIANDHPDAAPLVLTGDLMNEFLGDYSPLRYGGADYYRLPPLDPGKLRIALTRGIQTGDREVGVFAAHGLEVVQPYALAARPLLSWPEPVRKHKLLAGLAGALLPATTLARPKVRAQIGDRQTTVGILPTLIRHGHDQRQLEAEFCDILGIPSRSQLAEFQRAGVYRPPPRSWPGQGGMDG